ncbi:MAG: SLBB domain-containing protein [Ignavibacteria bacterium]|nr:SLBB domain-containing protein [Ignavibacteria bacterium]
MEILKQIEPMATTQTIYNDQIFEGPVDPDKYVVGPNDIFSLGVWGIVNQPLPLAVSPEGSLIIPSVGEIDVNGLTLSQTKEKVISAVKRRYISANVSLTLISPRRFLITVTGVGQGNYPISATMRASTIIAFIMADSVSLIKSGTSPSERGLFSLRNISVKRKNGEIKKVDLLKYYATLDERYNPFLREGDVINIPKYDWDQRYISVFGAVQFPRFLEYIEGDDLETVIKMCGGITTMANPDSIMIARLDPSGKKMTTFYFSLGRDGKMRLEPNDRVMVTAKISLQRDYKVYVLGEVMRPGLYPISQHNTRLTEVLREAGGLTPFAYLPTSEVYRHIDTFFVQHKYRDTLEFIYTQRLNDIVTNKDEKELLEQDIKYRLGRVNIDFEKLGTDPSQDIILQHMDVIYIANNKKQVYVYGQVNNPGFVPYKEGADYNYYISQSGGLSERADENEIRVIKFKTREWLDPDEAVIQSNDFIYVPKVVKRDFAFDIDLFSKVASVIVSIVTLTLLIIQSQR